VALLLPLDSPPGDDRNHDHSGPPLRTGRCVTLPTKAAAPDGLADRITKTLSFLIFFYAGWAGTSNFFCNSSSMSYGSVDARERFITLQLVPFSKLTLFRKTPF